MNNVEQGISQQRILIADDEPDIGEVISAVAEDIGFNVTYIKEGNQVVSQVSAIDPSVIVLDLRLPGADGVEIIRRLAELGSRASIVLISGMDQRTLNTVESLGREKNLEMAGTLVKPMHPDQIESMLQPLFNSSIVAQSADISPLKIDPEAQIGPLVRYELLEPLGQHCEHRKRALIEGCWRMDSGEFITGKRLAKWSENQGVSKGMLNIYLRDSMRQWASLQGADDTVELIFKIDAFLLHDVSVTDLLVQIVEQYSVPHHVLAIETSLSDIQKSQESAIDVLARLRINGFRIALVTDPHDDELLVMADKLPVDEIVVDMSALNGENKISNKMELEFQYSSITSMARKKGLESCAKNIATQQLKELVQNCQFDWARGSIYHHPMSAMELQRNLFAS